MMKFNGMLMDVIADDVPSGFLTDPVAVGILAAVVVVLAVAAAVIIRSVTKKNKDNAEK